MSGDVETKVFPTLSLEDTRRLKLCRICRGKTHCHVNKAGYRVPFVFNYGKEYAHQDCIDRVKKLGYTLPEYRK